MTSKIHKFNILIKFNKKEWLVFCIPVDFDECKNALKSLSKKYSNIKIV